MNLLLIRKGSIPIKTDTLPSYFLPKELPLVSGISRQPLPIAADVPWRFVINFRTSAEAAKRMLPAPLLPDLREGMAFVSVCVLEMENIGLPWFRHGLGFQNYEFLVRIGVLAPSQSGPQKSFYTLGSVVSSPWMAVLGKHFSIYKPRHARMQCHIQEGGISLSALEKNGSQLLADFFAKKDAVESAPESVFSDTDAAISFLLGMEGAVDLSKEKILWQQINHPPWRAHFVARPHVSLPFLNKFTESCEAELTYDSTLLIEPQRQLWTSTKLLK